MRYIWVHRRGYTRKDGTRVRPTKYREKDRGKPGKGPRIIPIRKGAMHGYHTSLPRSVRHRILRKLVREEGARKVWYQLNAQVILRKRENDRAKRIFEEDRNWVKEEFHPRLGKKRR